MINGDNEANITLSLNICPESNLWIINLKTTLPFFSSYVFPSCNCLIVQYTGFLTFSHPTYLPHHVLYEEHSGKTELLVGKYQAKQLS